MPGERKTSRSHPCQRQNLSVLLRGIRGWLPVLMKPCACLLFALLVAPIVSAADKFTVTVSHDLSIARPSEVISIPWKDVAKAVPGALLQHLAVKDSAGHILPYQVTNIAPEAK